MASDERRTATWRRAFGLTDREITIMEFVVEGHDTRLISGRLVISTRTVEKHIEHALRKLGVQSRVAAVARLLAPPPDGSADSDAAT